MSFVPIAKVIPDDPVVMVEVIAPADLKEGYQFEAIYNGETFPVTVPVGGVVKGQKLVVPVKENYVDNIMDNEIIVQVDSISESVPLTGIGSGTTTTSTMNSYSRYDVNDIVVENSGNNNHGRWRAGFLDCLELGPLHPTLCNSIFCQPIMLGQILTRLKLNMFALPTSNNDVNNTFKNVLTLYVWYWILTTIVFVADPDDSTVVDKNGNITVLEATKTMNGKIHGLLIFCFRVYCITLMIQLRRVVRKKHQINGGNLIKDLLASFLCGICTVSQLARETAEYYDNNAMWCSNNGLKQQQHTPEIV